MNATRILEECALNAWPGLQEQVYDGWLLRFAAGFTRRANSVNALCAGERPLEEKVARCERVYAGREQPCVFKITPLARPAELDALLDARGYRREGETRVMMLAPLDGAAAPWRQGPTLHAPWDDAWLEAFTRLDAIPARHRETLRALLRHIPVRHTGALLRDEGRPVSCGRATCEQGWMGLYDLVTDPAVRRRGYARRLIAGLLAWGGRQGAQGAFLQVEADNAPAAALYDKLGFREAYRYWYRVR